MFTFVFNSYNNSEGKRSNDVANLSDLVINVDKDWNDKKITNMEYLKVDRTGTPTGTVDSAIQGKYDVSIPQDVVMVGVYGHVKNNGTATMGTGHGIGFLGLAEDTVGSNHEMYGMEGRCNGYSTEGTYYGALGLATYQGQSYNGSAFGIQSRVEITTNGSDALTQGTAVAFYAPAIIGGNVKYSFWGVDAMRLDSALYLFDPGGINYGALQKFEGYDLFITSDNGQINMQDDNLVTTGFVDATSFKAGGTAAIANGDYTLASGDVLSIKGGLITAIA